MEAVEVIPDHEIERKPRAGELLLVPVAVGSLNDTKPVRGCRGTLGSSLTGCDVA
jgi:hypothetical protein